MKRILFILAIFYSCLIISAQRGLLVRWDFDIDVAEILGADTIIQCPSDLLTVYGRPLDASGCLYSFTVDVSDVADSVQITIGGSNYISDAANNIWAYQGFDEIINFEYGGANYGLPAILFKDSLETTQTINGITNTVAIQNFTGETGFFTFQTPMFRLWKLNATSGTVKIRFLFFL
jgi:hypothetical protein